MTGTERRTTWMCLALCAWAVLLPSGCQTGGTESVRAKTLAPHGTAEDSEADNRTVLERLAFWDRVSITNLNATPPAESFTLRGDGLKASTVPASGTYSGMLAGAHELFRQGKHAEACQLYKYLGQRERIPPQIAEEARYHEAECYRLQGYYPSAADTYTDLLNKFPSTLYREQAVQHMYDIANYWLDDTRDRMKEMKEYREGKRWWVDSRFVSFDRSKPLLDREGNALKTLENVRYNDINGPLADKALFLCGSVQYFNENYREADYFFTQIHERHPNSPLAAQALELAIVAKHMSTGGSDYDGRKAAEARKLIDSALANYPELAQKRPQMENQRAAITFQQAEKDFKQADFYQRRGKPGAAYFYYDIVRTTYKDTPYAKLATERMEQLREQVEAQGGSLPPVPVSNPTPNPNATAPPPQGIEQAPPPKRV